MRWINVARSAVAGKWVFFAGWFRGGNGGFRHGGGAADATAGAHCPDAAQLQPMVARGSIT